MSEMESPETVTTSLAELLVGVLAGVRREVAGAVGTAVSVAHPAPQYGAGRLQVLAATGVGHVLPTITTGHLWGPSLLAAAGEEPVVAADLWTDPRWPHLTLEAVRAQLPERHHAEVSQVRGVAAVPGTTRTIAPRPSRFAAHRLSIHCRLIAAGLHTGVAPTRRGVAACQDQGGCLRGCARARLVRRV